MVVEVVRWCSVFTLAVWPAAFVLPNALRAAGDVRFTMITSLVSMWIFRIGMSYLLGEPWGLNMGLLGVWLAMCIDWVVRAMVFAPRFIRGKWKNHAVI